MRIFIGILSTILVLTGAILVVLAMWDIYPISWLLILKAGLTIAVICATYFLLWLIKTIFFQKDLFGKSKKDKQLFD